MIQHFKYKDDQLVEIGKAEPGSWVNIYPPFNKEELEGMSNRLNIPIDFFIDALDVDERSRFESEEGIQFIVLNVPIKSIGENIEAIYTTIPIGIIENPEYLVTISSSQNEVTKFMIASKKQHKNLNNHSLFVLELFERANMLYLNQLKILNTLRNQYEKGIVSQQQK